MVKSYNLIDKLAALKTELEQTEIHGQGEYYSGFGDGVQSAATQLSDLLEEAKTIETYCKLVKQVGPTFHPDDLYDIQDPTMVSELEIVFEKIDKIEPDLIYSIPLEIFGGRS